MEHIDGANAKKVKFIFYLDFLFLQFWKLFVQMWMMFHINAANAFKNYWQSCKWMMEINLVYLYFLSGRTRKLWYQKSHYFLNFEISESFWFSVKHICLPHHVL